MLRQHARTSLWKATLNTRVVACGSTCCSALFSPSHLVFQIKGNWALPLSSSSQWWPWKSKCKRDCRKGGTRAGIYSPDSSWCDTSICLDPYSSRGFKMAWPVKTWGIFSPEWKCRVSDKWCIKNVTDTPTRAKLHQRTTFASTPGRL